ncbi:MAG: hypothetical protein ACLPWD_03705 [Methanobacterium sp.]
MLNLIFILIITAAALNGILAGSSLDQSIKQLPSRHKIGMIAYSAYSRASDLGNGIWWYAILGVSAAALTIVAAFVAHFYGLPAYITTPLYFAGILAVLHSLVTIRAAPINFSQRKAIRDQFALEHIFNRFERWQELRAVLQVLNFVVMLWVLVLFTSM